MEIKKTKSTSARKLSEMEKVLFDKTLAQKEPNREIYFVWRGIEKKNGLRYDITEIPAGMLDKEFVRTKGNRNSGNFPELYTILEGKAIFLLQKTKPDKIDAAEDAVAIKTQKGDWVNVPADYSVIIINPDKKTLKTGNWVSDKNQNIYEELEKMEGMCYFYTSQGWIKNKNYSHIPKLRFEKPFKKMPKSLEYLKG